VTAADIERIRAGLPELPADRKRRFVEEFGLPAADAHLLTLECGLAEYFEAVARLAGNPRQAANFVLNDLLRSQNAAGRDESDIPLPAAHLAQLIRLVHAGTLSHSAARGVFEHMYRTGRAPEVLIDELGVQQVDDADYLRGLVRQVVAAHPAEVEKFRRGRTQVLGFLVGQVMKASGGRAHPVTVNHLLEEEIG
jgi:aspartyl-tRNA(Asn)/glutamyl-tRNA(Gln) amidotransferase subunit B